MKTVKQNKKITYILFLIGLLAIIFYGALTIRDVYSAESKLNARIEHRQDISKNAKVIVNFSATVNGQYNLNNISITPSLQFKPRLLSNKQLEINILEAPQPNTKYTIYINKVPTFWLNMKKNVRAEFFSIITPTKIKVSPADQQKEVSYQEKIKINLNHSLHPKIFLKVEIVPNIKVATTINEARDSIILTPQQEFAKGQKYDLKITTKYRDDETFSQKLYQGSFITKIPPQVVYGFDKNGEPAKTENITWEITPKITSGKYIDIDLTHQVMSIFQDGLRKGAYKVSTGKRSMKTPTGTFRVMSKRRRPWSAHYGLYMPWYMGFTSMGHGIHELPEWPSGYKEGANHLGIPVSHGCVRLGIGPAKVVYDFSPKGTPIVVHY